VIMSGGGSGGVPPEVEVSQESLDQVWQSIRENLLTPKGNHHPPAGRAPRVAFVAGQPASGKSSIEDYVKRDLELDNPVQIDADALRELHPAYDEWAKKDTLTAAARTQEVVGDWVDKAIAYVTGPNQRFDAVVSATLKNPDKARAKIKPFHDRHYDVFVAFTAVDRINSSLAIVKRYLKGNRPGRWARYVPLDVHELACEGVLQTARQITRRNSAISTCGSIARSARGPRWNWCTRTPLTAIPGSKKAEELSRRKRSCGSVEATGTGT